MEEMVGIEAIEVDHVKRRAALYGKLALYQSPATQTAPKRSTGAIRGFFYALLVEVLIAAIAWLVFA